MDRYSSSSELSSSPKNGLFNSMASIHRRHHHHPHQRHHQEKAEEEEEEEEETTRNSITKRIIIKPTAATPIIRNPHSPHNNNHHQNNNNHNNNNTTMKLFPSYSPSSARSHCGRPTTNVGSTALPLTSSSPSPSKQKQQHGKRSSATPPLVPLRKPNSNNNNKSSSLLIALYVQRAIIVLVFLRFTFYVLWMHSYLITGDSSSRTLSKDHQTAGSGVVGNGDNNVTSRYITFQQHQQQPYQRHAALGENHVETPKPLLQLHPQQQLDNIILPDWKPTKNKGKGEPKKPASSKLSSSSTYRKQQQYFQSAEERARERRKRTRPNSIQGQVSQSFLVSPSLDPLLHNPGIPRTTISVPAANNAKNWTFLCQKAMLNRNSRLVVTNVLSNDIGPALVLLLARQCGVQNVIGIDTLFPNVRHHRMSILDTNYRLLLRHVSKFTLHVPMQGLSKKKGFQRTLQSIEAPTHVVHLESSRSSSWTATGYNNKVSDEGDDDADDALLEPESERLYALSHSLLTWEHVLIYAQTKSSRPAMVHVSLPPPVSGSASAHFSSLLAARLSPVVSMAHPPRGATHLHFGNHSRLVGPMIQSLDKGNDDDDDDDHNEKLPVLFAEDALTAVLQALGSSQQQLRNKKSNNACTILNAQTQWSLTPGQWLEAMTSRSGTTNTTSLDTTTKERVAQTLAWDQSRKYPLGLDPKGDSNSSPQLDSGATSFLQTYGIQSRRFPCSSTCSSTLSSCRSSAWDLIRQTSQIITAQCRFVVYIVDLTRELEELVEPTGGEQYRMKNDVCRIAFVSGQSTLVQNQLMHKLKKSHGEHETDTNNKTMITKEHLEQLNGKLEYNQWTLIWLPNDDDTSLNDADHSLPKIDPSGLFADTVNKALYAEMQGLVEPSDYSLTRIMSQIDRPALGRRKKRERRRGTQIARWVPVPKEPARHTIIFAGEPKESLIPKSIGEFVKLAGNRFHFPPRQLSYYEQISHLVQTNDMRPEGEIRSTAYFSFPFQWITMAILIHDMKSETSRQLRCSWYDEYLYWGGGNRNAEELSFAYVMGRRRIAGDLGQPLEDDGSWSPLLVPSDGTRKKNPKGAEFFVRLMKHREGASSQQQQDEEVAEL